MVLLRLKSRLCRLRGGTPEQWIVSCQRGLHCVSTLSRFCFGQRRDFLVPFIYSPVGTAKPGPIVSVRSRALRAVLVRAKYAEPHIPVVDERSLPATGTRFKFAVI